MLAVKSDQRLYDGRWRDRVDAIADRLPDQAWHRLSAGAGSKGPRVYDWAAESFGQVDARGWRLWLLVRRHVERPTERASYLGRGPASTSREELVRVAGSRWAVEECFERAKGDCGLDHYEVRSWVGWYRHITLSMFALAWLVAVRAKAGAEPPPRPRGPRLIPLTVPEVRTLLLRIVWNRLSPAERVLAWSDWRRVHQQQTNKFHYNKFY